jgi:protein involved in polysaccharide export with SLBB domain
VLDKAYLTRTKPDLTLEFIPFDLSAANSPVLQNKDKITIVGKPDYDKGLNISVDGAVRNAVNTAFAEGMTLGDALRLAGGLLPNADYSRVEVSRLNAFSEFQKGTNRQVRTTALLTEVPRELSRDLTVQSEALNFALQPYDQIIVREIPEYKLQQMVYIGGEVQYPGFYAIMARDEKLTNLMGRAGGPTRYADIRNAQLLRENAPNIVVNLQKAVRGTKSPFNYVLLPGDRIEIPRVDNLVSIVGTGHKYYENADKVEINVPFTYRRSARRYVTEYALGFAKKADKKALYVEYPNGKVDKTKNFGLFKDYPTVKKGGTIHIALKSDKVKEEKQRREQKPFDMNQAVATVTAALTSFATLYVLLTR